MSIERDRYTAALFNSIVGRIDVYGLQKSDGRYGTIRKSLTLKVLRDHISGARTVGSYLVPRCQLEKL